MSIYRTLRTEKGLSAKQVAEYLGTDAGNYSRIERMVQNVTVEQLCKLADLFHVSTDVLLERDRAA